MAHRSPRSLCSRRWWVRTRRVGDGPAGGVAAPAPYGAVVSLMVVSGRCSRGSLPESPDRPQASPGSAGRRCGGPHAVRRVWQTRGVDFDSVYAQGYVRVAACATPTAIADPATNARTVLEEARACDAEGVGVALFPELALTGYAIDDLLLQQPVLDQVEDSLLELAAGTADLRRCWWWGRRCGTGTGCSTRAVVMAGGEILGRGAQVVPADLPRVLRAPALRPR